MAALQAPCLFLQAIGSIYSQQRCSDFDMFFVKEAVDILIWSSPGRALSAGIKPAAGCWS